MYRYLDKDYNNFNISYRRHIILISIKLRLPFALSTYLFCYLYLCSMSFYLLSTDRLAKQVFSGNLHDNVTG